MKKPRIIMADIEKIEITVLEVTPTTAEVDAEIDRQCPDEPSYAAKDGCCSPGDRLVVDFTASADGEPIADLAVTALPFVPGSGNFLPGFDAQMAGATAGGRREVTITFPPDYAVDTIAGRTIVFDVTVRAVEAPCKIKVDDAFARKIGFDSARDIRRQTRKLLVDRYAARARAKAKRELLEKLDATCQFDVPDGLVEAAFAEAWPYEELMIEMAEKPEPIEEARARCRREAARRIRLDTALAAIGYAERVEVEETDIEEALQARCRDFHPQDQPQIYADLRKDAQALERIRHETLKEKTIEMLLARVKCRRRKMRCRDLAEGDQA